MRGQILEHSNDKFREIFEKSPIGILFYDAEGKLTDANQSALQIAAVSHLEDIKGTNLFDNYYIESHKEELLKKGFIRFESPIDLDKIKEMGFFTPIREGIIYVDYTISITDSGFLAQIQDITEHKKANDSIEKSQIRLKEIVGSITDGFFSLDVDWRFIYINSRAASNIGKKPEDLIGKNLWGEFTGIVDTEHELAYRKAMENREFQQFEINGVLTNKCYDISVYPSAEGISVYWKDITRRKKAEEELMQARFHLEEQVRARTKELEITIDSIAEGVVIQNRKGDIIRINDVAKRYYESLELDSKDNIKERVEKYKWFYSDGTPVTAENVPIARALRGEVVKDVDLYLEGINEVKWLTASAIPLYDKTGKLFGGVLTFNDTTDRKKAEYELKSRALLLDASNEAIFSWGYDNGILSWNEGAKRLYGYSKEEAIGKTNHDLLKTEFPSGFNELMDKLENERLWDGELIHTTKDKRKIIVESHMQLLNNDTGKEIVIESNRDITDRKKTEKHMERYAEELSTERQRLYDMLEKLPVMICLLTPDYHVKFANRTFRERFGEAHDRPCYEYLFGFNEPCHWCQAYQVLETGKLHSWELETPDSSIIDVYNMPFTDVDGSPLILEMDIDVTEQKLNERELQKVLSDLKRSNEELEQFAYVSSHDLQEPLRTIASFTQLLERRYKGKFDSDADEFMDYIVEAAVRMKEQIEGLLEYSRVGTKGEKFLPVNLNEILNQTIQTLYTSIEESNAKINVDELPTVTGDASQLQRIFQNLISNAIKFRKQEEPLKINICANRDIYNDEYVFSIEDNGIGIEEQYSERIFTIFQRLHTREEYKGTGIGLSIVKRIIERHGGRIWVESESGVGSTFYFTVPLSVE